MIFDKEVKTIQWIKESIFNVWYWSHYIQKKIKIDPDLSLCTKLKSKWNKYLNVKPDTLNLIEQKLDNSLEIVGMGDNFLNKKPIS